MLAEALLQKSKRIQPESRIALCDEILRRFGGADDLMTRGKVALALRDKTRALMERDAPDNTGAGLSQED
jgi:hypothetical protein